jgi:hypothetical protein
MTLRRQFIGLPDRQESALQMIIDLIVLSRSKQQPQNQIGRENLRLGLVKARSTAPNAVCILSGLFWSIVYGLSQNNTSEERFDWIWNSSGIFCQNVVVSVISEL